MARESFTKLRMTPKKKKKSKAVKKRGRPSERIKQNGEAPPPSRASHPLEEQEPNDMQNALEQIRSNRVNEPEPFYDAADQPVKSVESLQPWQRDQLVRDLLLNHSVPQCALLHQIPAQVVKDIIRLEQLEAQHHNMLMSQTKRKAATQANRILDSITDEDLDEATLRDKAYAVGEMVKTARLLNDDSTENVHILNDLSDAQIQAAMKLCKESDGNETIDGQAEVIEDGQEEVPEA